MTRTSRHYLAGIAGMLLVLASAPASARTSIQGVRLGTHPDGVTRVVMDVSASTTFRVQLQSAPDRIVIVGDDLVWATAPALRQAMGAITAIRYDNAAGQVVIELRRPATVKTSFMLSPAEGMGWRFVMDLKETTAQAFRAAATPVAAPATPPSPARVAESSRPTGSNSSRPAGIETSRPAVTAVSLTHDSPAEPPAVAPPAVFDEAAARTVVRNAIADLLESFAGKPLKPAEARAATQRLVDRYADFGLESSQILGRYWERASPEQRKEFQGLLNRFFVTMAAGMVEDMPAGQKITIMGSEWLGEHVIVHTQAMTPNEPPSTVDWTVMMGSNGRPVITDVSTDGAAIVATMRDDFTSVVRNAASGGIAALFEPLRRKIGGGAATN